MTAVARTTRRLSTDPRLRLAILIVCILGIGDAGYLTYVHYSGAKALCTFGGGCEAVQTSRWATLDGVPIAILGLIGYVSVLLSLAIRHEARARRGVRHRADRIRLQRVPHLSRALHDQGDLPVVRRECGVDDRADSADRDPPSARGQLV